ncbi:hypothetical protein [Saccharothrix syringae]|uniref:Uncharacterized protein n=1 Tax=Saccharothrix syringae TaxID=103733 RepID=A0A5Q0H432_SACSY|nr:hypothetical protein [Saccharothrix syringae]QFZ20879.1 hypothetical protein EKG83_28945 [Saccharothrix syringae]
MSGSSVDEVAASIRLVLLGVVAVIQPGLGLVPLLSHDRGPGATAAYLALTLVTLVCAVWIVRRRPVPEPVVALGAVVVLVASAVATAALPPGGHFGAGHWSFGLAGWHLLVLLADRPRLSAVALGAHTAAGIAQFALAGAPDRTAIGAAGVVVLGVTSFQFGVLLLTRVLLRNARRAAEAAVAQERAATRAAAAEQWARDLRTGFAGGLGSTLPLLADLADGVLDPRAEETRRRCAFAATQLRRLFAEQDDSPDPLVHEVSACVDVAERRGLVVSLAVSGEVVPVPTDVRRQLTAPVAAALSAARERARVSLLRADGEVRVAVVADAAVPVDPAPGPVEVRSDTYGGQTRTEARWRTG